MNTERSGADRRTTEHCDMHLTNSETLIDHSTSLSQIKGGLIVASASLGFILTICAGAITYYVGQMTDTVKVLSTDMREIHQVVHQNQLITTANAATLENMELEIKEIKAVRK